MRNVLERFLSGVTADSATEFFLWVLCVAFAVAWWANRQRKWEGATAHAPTLLTTAGVLGTFVGIAIGLVNFQADPDKLQTSVTDLLAGLTTAFLTSLVGMSLGLVLRLRLQLRARSEETAAADVGPQDILTVLQKHTDLLRQSRDAIAGTEESSLAGQLKLMRTDLGDHRRESLRFLGQSTALLQDTRDAIAGTEESSLAGQLKLLRTDLADQHRDFSRELWKRLTEFSELLARSATEQVIEALKQVIVEFNEKLTEQFGDNFKALDASVKKLVEWQDRYRIQLERLHALYEESVRSIGNVETSMRSIEESSAAIPSTMRQLRTLIETANQHVAELERHLAAFVKMRDQAVEAVPQTQASIDRIIASVHESMDQVTSSHSDLVAQAGQRHEELMAQVDGVQQAMASGLRSAQDVMAIAQREHQAKTGEMLRTIAESADGLREDAAEARKASDAHLRNMEQALAEQRKRSTEIVSAFQAAGERIVRESGEMNRQLGESAKQMRSNLEAMMRDATQSQSRAARATVAAFSKEMTDMVKKTRTAIEQQQRGMNQMMMKEIEGVMNEMATALGQIATRFANEYGKLSTRTAAALRSLEDRGHRF